MDEILTNDELEALLHAISGSPSDRVENEMEEPKKIRTYDFKKPDKFSKEHLKSFHHIFETYVRLATQSLSTKYEAPISFHLISIDQLSYEEYSKLVTESSILGIASLKPLMGFSIVELDNLFIFSLIDFLLGGKGEILRQPREFKDLETPIVQNILETLIYILGDAFKSIFKIKSKLDKMESYSYFHQKQHLSEIVLQASIDAKLKSVSYRINICIPYSTLEPIIYKFTNKEFNIEEEINKDSSLSERKKKILESCSIRTYSEFQAGTVFIQPNGEHQDFFHEVNINLTPDSKSSHYFKTIFKNFIRTTEVI